MYIILIKGPSIGGTFPLKRTDPNVIGRGKECDIRILDLMISRKHCQIEERNGVFYIKDLKSTNKTILNKKIVEDEEKLNTGDIIKVGNTILLFTDQKDMSIKSVEEYEQLRTKQTMRINLPQEQSPGSGNSK